MLNEWSDRRPPGPPRPFYRRGEFGVAVFAVVAGCGFLLGLLSWVMG